MPIKSAYSVSDESASSPGVLERGSLRTQNGRSHFIGSSSGVFFVSTVRHAFANAGSQVVSAAASQSAAVPEDCFVPNEDDASSEELPALGAGSSVPLVSRSPANTAVRLSREIPPELGSPPPPDVARELFMTYFRTWHIFFPFLHGPTVASDLEWLYLDNVERLGSSVNDTHTWERSVNGCQQPLPLPRAIILQCVFNLAALHGAVQLPATSQIQSPRSILPCLIGFAAQGDTLSIQAMFAVELLLVARMSLRTAVIVAGLLSRTIFLAGLHRCPVRYEELSEEDCDIRKRLFWSIYVVDRYLSQALGHPLGIQDSDIDVCSVTGPELHVHPESTAASHDRAQATPQSDSSSRNNLRRILGCQVEHARLLGRTVELFHKSIHVRSIDPQTVLSLRTDLDAWWNSLPANLQESSFEPETSTESQKLGESFNASAFFLLLNNQLRLLMNRPWLSLEPSTPEFQSALQTCIAASRDIIISAKKMREASCALFWPGHLSAVWMAGILLAFACHLDLHPPDKGQSDIATCLNVLTGICSRWPAARNCELVLSDLDQTLIQNRQAGIYNSRGRAPSGIRTSSLSTVGAPTAGEQVDDPVHRAPPADRVKRRRIATSIPPTRSSNEQYMMEESPSSETPDQIRAEAAQQHMQGPDVTVAPPGGPDLQNHQPRQLMPTQPDMASLGTTGGFFNSSELGTLAPMPQYVEGSVSGNWDSGMLDILGGAAWETLFQDFSRSHTDWGGDF